MKVFDLTRFRPTIEPDVIDAIDADAARAAALKTQASQMLLDTDYVIIKHAEGGAAPTAAWLAWREALRQVVRGNATDIPPEPERYNAP